MRQYFALDPLQRVVDRLRVAAEPLGHLFVARALEVELEGVVLERGQTAAEREDEALQLLRRDHDEGRLVDDRAWERIAERAFAVRVLPGRRVAERDVLVQRLVLEAGRRLDRCDDLTRNAELREAAKRRLLVGAEIANRLVQTDQALLNQVVGVAAGEEVRARLQPDEAGVAPDELVERNRIAVSCLEHEAEILELSLRLMGR